MSKRAGGFQKFIAILAYCGTATAFLPCIASGGDMYVMIFTCKACLKATSYIRPPLRERDMEMRNSNDYTSCFNKNGLIVNQDLKDGPSLFSSLTFLRALQHVSLINWRKYDLKVP